MFGVELFAGAGGLSFGAQKAGLDVSFAIEKDQPAARTFAANHTETQIICDDIRAISPKSLGLPSKKLVLFGGPPCQGFSTSNQKNRSKENVNNWLFEEFLRFVEELSPEVVLFENVAGIVHTAGGFFLKELVHRLETLGYHTTHSVLDATHSGVPQRRHRFFCIGCKSKPIFFPTNTVLERTVTVKDAIYDLPVLSVGNATDEMPYRKGFFSNYAAQLRDDCNVCTGNLVTNNAPHIVERYEHIPQGGNWSDIPAEMMTTYKDASRCHTGIYKRLQLDQPSIVLGNFRKNMLIHPTQNRGLSVREAARIQSFPDSYQFLGSIGQQQQQVGNAVPPLMAQTVFRSIFDQLSVV